jgi:two-component system, OmpR family, KDP operon response regulator KdpE
MFGSNFCVYHEAGREDKTLPNLKKSSSLPRVLVVGDEQEIICLLRTSLTSSEFSLHQADNGHAALAAASEIRPDIILLDLGASELNGIGLIGRIREWSQVPIIVLSVRDGEDDKVDALDAGADDYLIKPFSIAELHARVRVSLKRSLQQAPKQLVSCRGLEVDLTRRRAAWLGEDVEISPIEYDLLRLMVSHTGKVLSHSQILRQVWGASGNSRLIWSDRSQCFRVRL